MPKCCPCNGIHARCKSCICVRSNRPCSSCQPIKRSSCFKKVFYDPSGFLPRSLFTTYSLFTTNYTVYSLLSSPSPQSDSNMPQPLTATPQPQVPHRWQQAQLLPSAEVSSPPRPSPQSSSSSSLSMDMTLSPDPTADTHKKPCIVQDCQAILVAPSMWKFHLEGHIRGSFCGSIPDAWLKEHNRFICHQCSSLVSISHKQSHSKKCITSPSEPSVLPHAHLSAPTVVPGQDSHVLPTLSEICNLRCSTLRFIPNKAKPAFACILSAALRAVVAENSVESWTKLFMLPKCVLPSSKRRGHHNKPVPIDLLCERWSSGYFTDLWHLSVQRASFSTTKHHSKDDSTRKVASAISFAQNGLYGKACQVLTSSGVAPNNDNTWRLMVSKHPTSACPSVPPMPLVDTKLPSDINIMAILRSFPKLTGAGPSGLRIQHLIDAAEVPLQTPILHSLRAIVNLLASGNAQIEIATFLAGGNITALNKSTPGDIRPIAVGEVLRRLTSKCLCAAVRAKAASFFEPYQFGVACPSGAEKIAHGLRACIEEHWADDDFGVLKVDMKNAFNVVSRQEILVECAKHFPELLPW